jgi:translation initiation factor 2 gamma subunit (eIF-2gamma)
MEKSSANPELLNSISGTHTVLLKNRVERNIAIRLGYL